MAYDDSRRDQKSDCLSSRGNVGCRARGRAFPHRSIFGAAREADEGTAAHLWQLLMACQLPILIFFGIKWLPRRPKLALIVMALQFCAAVAALTPVYILNL